MAAVPTDDRLFRAVFEGTLDALLLTDDDGIYIHANEASCELFGCSREELIGRSIADFVSADIDAEAMWEDFVSNGRSRGQLDIHRPDGEVRTVEYAASADIRPGVHLSAIRDVSEREPGRVELSNHTEMLGRMFETSPVGIVIVDANGAILDANDRAESVLGLDHDEITDRTYGDDRWHPMKNDGTALPKSELPVAIALENGEAVFDFEHGIKSPNGATVWLSVNAAPIFDTDGTVDRVVTVVSDVTERREYRRLLEQQNERLEEYSATVSHDLRSPLSVASGWLDVAIEEDSTEPLDKVRDALERMGTLITDLRSLGRYGQTVDGMVELELEPLVESAWSNVETAEATLTIDGALGTIHGESGRVLQLFENLFRNAVDHVGPSATVRVGPLDRGFYVEDDGSGIPADNRDSVFEFGYTTLERGTGIGLTIVEAIADAHGWWFELTDTDPHGARFEFQSRWHPDYDGR
ncbi:PAS domain S-box protein [Natronomonas sp.]|uniref:PAS domain S-box protein n=1 Tax=Natronomonas sp. TaxID=2184060 RepID=UPI003974B9B1